MKELQRVDPGAYARVFEGHHDGVLILQDLVARFYDVNVFVRGGIEGQRETERRAARREVLQYILHRIGQVQEPPPEDEQDPNPAG